MQFLSLARLRPLHLVGIALLAGATGIAAAPAQDVVESIAPTHIINANLDSWSGTFHLYPDGVAELSDGTDMGKWHAVLSEESTPSVVVNLGTYGNEFEMRFDDYGMDAGGPATFSGPGFTDLGTWDAVTLPDFAAPFELCFDLTFFSQQPANGCTVLSVKGQIFRGRFWFEANLEGGKRILINEVQFGSLWNSGLAQIGNEVVYLEWNIVPN